MIQCSGRSLHTVKMPKKPIKQGYKVFALAEHGYIWTYSWSSRKQGIMEMFKYPGFTRTESMVMNMVESLPTRSTIPAAIPTPISTAIPPTILPASQPAPPTIPPPIPAAIPPTILPTSQPARAAIQPAIQPATPPAISVEYSIYMDNYFNSVRLFQLLHDHGYGACGTARVKCQGFAS